MYECSIHIYISTCIQLLASTLYIYRKQHIYIYICMCAAFYIHIQNAIVTLKYASGCAHILDLSRARPRAGSPGDASPETKFLRLHCGF